MHYNIIWSHTELYYNSEAARQAAAQAGWHGTAGSSQAGAEQAK